jgi:hypothetical protein
MCGMCVSAEDALLQPFKYSCQDSHKVDVCACFLSLQVPAELLVERVVGRRMDPQTGSVRKQCGNATAWHSTPQVM